MGNVGLVKVTFFGTRGSCPCAGDAYKTFGGNTSCVAIDTGEEAPLILDAGTGLRALGAFLRPKNSKKNPPLHARLLLTHLHYDHLLGLPFFSPLEDPGSLVEVYGPQQGDAEFAAVIDSAVTPPFFPVQMKEFRGEVRLIGVGDETFQLGTATVKARWIPHSGPTLGFRIDVGGASLAYVPDHQAPSDGHSIDDAVLELCADVDVLIHDAQYDNDEFSDKADWGHSTTAYAVHVAAQSRAKSLVLFHHDPSHDDAYLLNLESEAALLEEAAGLESVIAAREGMTLHLDHQLGTL